MSEADHYRNTPSSADGQLGHFIYHAALAYRRGFRTDQIGIPDNDEVWVDIFEDIGFAAREGVKICDR
jgi:hypothetical protein